MDPLDDSGEKMPQWNCTPFATKWAEHLFRHWPKWMSHLLKCFWDCWNMLRYFCDSTHNTQYSRKKLWWPCTRAKEQKKKHTQRSSSWNRILWPWLNNDGTQCTLICGQWIQDSSKLHALFLSNVFWWCFFFSHLTQSAERKCEKYI